MNIMAVYHANMLGSLTPVSGLTSIRKGRHALMSQNVESDGELMAGSVGWMRNQAQLSRDLGYSAVASIPTLVMAAYRRWGDDYPSYIEGGVATVLIDRSADKMVISRDRMGDRRVFYSRRGRTVAMADHPDALIESPYASKVVNTDGLNELFAIGPARTPGRTPYRDVMALESGCYMVCGRNGIAIKRYFSLEAKKHEDDIEKTVITVRDMLERAVQDILPYVDSCMLSGGLDSTALIAIMSEMDAKPFAYTVEYEGDAEDFTGNSFQPERDGEYADMAAGLFASGSKKVILNHRELSRSLGAAVKARGFPGMADVDSSMYLFARDISPSARGIVSGECADEVFCGYPWFSEDIAYAGFPWSGSMDLRRTIIRRDILEIMKPGRYAEERFREAIDAVSKAEGESASDTRLRALQSACFKYFMSNLQERALAMCEANSLNIFTPFSDERLVNYAWNIPRDMLFYGGRVKGLLREAVKDILPERLLERKKSPYPKTYSAMYTKDVKALITNMLADSSSPVLKVVSPNVLGQLNAAELPANGLPWFGQLMSGPQMLAYIWQVNEWMRTRGIVIEL